MGNMVYGKTAQDDWFSCGHKVLLRGEIRRKLWRELQDSSGNMRKKRRKRERKGSMWQNYDGTRELECRTVLWKQMAASKQNEQKLK